MVNISTFNATVIDPGPLSYVPFEIWAVMFLVTFAFFVHGIIGTKHTNITALIATVLSGAMAWLSGFIQFTDTQMVTVGNNTTIVPINTIYSPPWMSFIFLGMFFVGILLTIRNVWEVHIASKPEWKQRRFK